MTIDAHLAPTRSPPHRSAAVPYQGVALELLRHVVDVLHALDTDAQNRVSRAAADQVARTSLSAAGRRYALGVPSYSQMPAARQQVPQTRIDSIAALWQRLIDGMTSYEAPGGEHAGAGENVSRERPSGI